MKLGNAIRRPVNSKKGYFTFTPFKIILVNKAGKNAHEVGVLLLKSFLLSTLELFRQLPTKILW